MVNLIFISLFCLLIYYLGGGVLLNNVLLGIKYRYNRFKSLNNLVETQHNSKIRVLFVSFKIIFKIILFSILQKLNKSIVKLSPNRYELTYVINGRIFKHIIYNRRGPSKVLQIINDDNEDITEKIEPYLGPQENFHKEKYTPIIFKEKSLTFNLYDGSSKTFLENETINI